MFERCFEKAFRFDFVMIHVGMYTKCSEMFRFEKELCNDSHWNVYKVFLKVRGVKSIFDLEQATRRLITHSEFSRFRTSTFL